jgi:hypothetical protein
MKSFLFATLLGVAAAGTVELSTGDLTGRNPSLDNIKGSWSQALKFLGRDATLSAEYDRNANKDFVNEATLSGSLDRLKYALTTSFDGDAELTLETSTDDGTVLEAETVLKGFAGGPRLTKVTASRSATVQGQDCDLEISHDISASESKLKLSTVLGSGITAIGSLSSKGGDSSLSYELEYDTELTKGRTLSASVSPADGTGEIEYEDSATLGDGTLTATFPLGGAPSITAKREFSF